MDERNEYLRWRNGTDERTSAELAAIENDEEEIRERFYRRLEFGTAGLRGLLAAGANRMNVYTVRQATQGLAEYLKQTAENPSAAVAYDTRHGSWLFAKEAAAVLAANGIKVWLYAEPAPTPMLSYAVRERLCSAGINITASHNPANYNGYKVYGPDGCQIGPETAEAVSRLIAETDVLTGAKTCDFDTAVAEKKILLLPDSFWRRYIARVIQEGVDRAHHAGNDLSIAYTPLNGTGREPVVRCLSLAGFGNIFPVEEQFRPDGDFPTCPFPNPELPEALELGIRLAKKENCDFLLATDPDCDRAGVASKDGDGYRILTGNEIGALLLDFIARARIENGIMPERPVAVRSMVSTKLADAVAAHYGIEMRKVFTGFRYVGQVIAELEAAGEADRYIFGFEESCGYLSGTYVRDKDAVNASLLICEAAAYWKRNGLTLAGAVDALRAQYGYYLDSQSNFYCEGIAGAEKIQNALGALRKQAPRTLAGRPVTALRDYLPEADMLELTLGEDASVIIRPSGTEPKVKAYYSVRGEDQSAAEAETAALKEAVTELLGL